MVAYLSSTANGNVSRSSKQSGCLVDVDHMPVDYSIMPDGQAMLGEIIAALCLFGCVRCLSKDTGRSSG